MTMNDAATLRVLNRQVERVNELETALLKASWERAMLLVILDRIGSKADSESKQEPDALLQAAIGVAYMHGAREGDDPVTDAEIERARHLARLAREITNGPM